MVHQWKETPVRRCARALSLVFVATLLTSCGLLGDSAEPATNPNSDGPELATLRIAVLPLPDIAPLRLAMKAHYFQDEGLDITAENLRICKSGSDCVAKLTAGEVEIAYSSWTPFLLAIDRNAADVHFVADATRLAPHNSPIMVRPDSGIHNIRDLAGKRIAITAKGTASHLLVASALTVNGVNPDSIQWIEAEFPLIASRIMVGDADAGYLAEPYTQMATRAGATPIFDTYDGPTGDLPLSGYGATGSFVHDKPKTVVAFQRALRRATEELQADRVTLEAIVAEYVKVTTVPTRRDAKPDDVSPGVATDAEKMAAYNTFHPGNVTRDGIIQVRDLMVEFGQLKHPLSDDDLAARIVPYAA
jgi:NitT/TauT family transport system substrate-binding protein